MPELPEVETIVRGLRPRLRGRRVEAVVVERPAAAPAPPARPARAARAGGRATHRRACAGVGKYILVDVDDERGRRRGHSPGHDRPPARRAGRTRARAAHARGVSRSTAAASCASSTRGASAGSRPARSLATRRRWRAGARSADRARRGRAGRGARRRARAHQGVPAGPAPRRRAGQHLRLRGAVPRGHPPDDAAGACARRAARAAGRHPRGAGGRIANRGTTLRDYVDADGQRGDNAAALLVYGREGEPCSRCRTLIRRRVDAGRSTFFCPSLPVRVTQPLQRGLMNAASWRRCMRPGKS